MELLLSLLLASVLQAPHPCDVMESTTAEKGPRVGWCHDLKDSDGLVDQTIGFKLIINANTVTLGIIAPLGSPSTTGMFYFEAPLPSGYSRGIYQIYMIAYNAEGDSPQSNLIGWQIGGPPNKPVKVRIP